MGRSLGPSTRPRGDDVPPCEECGKRHLTRFDTQACSGHVTRDRDGYVPGQPRPLLDEARPCTVPPMHGLDVCHVHGGKAHQEAGERRMTEERAARTLRRFGEPVDTTPTDALLDAVKWTAGYVAWLRDKVAEGTDDDERALTQLSTHTGKRETGVWVDLLGQWHDRLVRICTEAIKAGIEERRVRIAEQQGTLVADVIRRILGDLNLTPEQAAAAGDAVPRHLRALAS